MRGFARPQIHAFAGRQAYPRAQGFRMAHQQGRGAGGRPLRMAHQQALATGGRQFRRAQRQQGYGFARQGRAFAQQQHGFAHQQMAGRLAGAGVGPNRQGLAATRIVQQQTGAQQFGIQQLGRHPAAGAAANLGAAQRYAQPAVSSPYNRLAYGNNGQVLPLTQAQTFIGAPVAQVASFAPIGPIPAGISYLYPATPDYYYEWGNGYLYQIDRSDNLVAALIPMVAGGYLPGEYLPAAYMASYVPDYYGMDSFYPDEGDLCNRYYHGVIYQVDCDDGYVEDVVPIYAGGYGVGQLLPADYGYYNVPAQYRTVYYDTPDAGYWYSPGAIYRYDRHTSVITSVAALMAPGFTVGEPLPAGYEVYNVPLPYRATYYDTPSAWYRYNNGYIYQIDPVTQVVRAIVASLLA